MTTTTVLVETMPAHLRESHRVAAHWGKYPHNGAERRRVMLDEAEEIEASDPEYDHIVPGTEIEEPYPGALAALIAEDAKTLMAQDGLLSDRELRALEERLESTRTERLFA